MHDCVSWAAGHAAPPLPAAVLTVRERVMTPPPHVTLHEPHCANAFITQSVGQACVLHSSTCSRLGQTAPPSEAAVITERERVRRPPPHDFVQAVKSE